MGAGHRNRVFPAGTLMILEEPGLPPPINVIPWSVAVLAYMEQTTIANPYDEGLPADGSCTFWGWNGSPGCAVNASYGGTVIPSYVCPSAPDASARVVTALISNADMAAIGGVFGEIAALTGAELWFPMAPLDYGTFNGIHPPDSPPNYATFAYAAPHDIYAPADDAWGALPCQLLIDNATMLTLLGADTEIKQSTGVQSITDGTANTLLLYERTGGPNIYVKAGRVIDADDAGAFFGFSGDPAAAMAFANGGGWINPIGPTATFDGSPYVVTATNLEDDGPCAINCTSTVYSGMYSFHPGGINVCMADASVRWLGEATAPFLVASMITRENGEVFDLP